MNKQVIKYSSFLTAPIFLCGALQASIYWDTNGSTGGAGNPATGTWDAATTSNWTTDLTGASATSTFDALADTDVVFSAGTDATSAAVVTTSGTQLVSSVTFQEGDITLTGTNIDDAGTTIQFTVNDGANAIVDYSDGAYNADFDVQGSSTMQINVVRGGGGMAKTGTGTLTVHRLDASLTVNEGTVIYDTTGSGGSAKLKNTTVNDGGTLRLEANTFDGSKRSLQVNGTGAVEFASGVDQTISFFTGDGSVVGNGSTLKIGGDNKSTTFNGDISGDMDLHAIGTGTFTMSDATSMEIIVGGNGVNNSILGTGNINLNGELTFDLTGADLTAGNSWLIVDVDNLNETYGATFSIANFTESEGIWSYDLNALVEFSESTGELYVVPEPSSFALLAGCMGLAFVMLKRRA